MPIRLNDVATVHRFEIEPGVVVSYRRAKSGEVFAAVRETTTPDGKVDLVAADSVVLASCIVSWEGFEDSSGLPLPWPEDRALRRDLLEALPWNVVADIKGQVFSAAREATASGKG